MEGADLNGVMVVSLMEILRIIILKGRERILGRMGENMSVLGNKIKWKVLGNSPGPMAESTKESI